MRLSFRPQEAVSILIAFACTGFVAVLGLAIVSAVGSAPAAQPDSGPVTYFIGQGEGAAGFHPSDRELALWALESWARNSSGTLRLEPSTEEKALVRVRWAAGDGTLYGETRALTVGDRLGAEVYVTTNIDALGADNASRAQKDPLWRETIVYLTCLHELGHAFRLSHTADDRDIMYYFGYGGDIVDYFDRYRRLLTSREDIHSVSGLSPADVKNLLSLRRQR